MKKFDWSVYLIIFLNLVFFTFCFAQKKDFPVDEIFSFGQANSSTGAYLFPDIDSSLNGLENKLNNRWQEPSLFWDYVTVQDGEAFNYQQVIKNLSQGVHPPLFHLLLHTVSSFFPDSFNIWLGYILNLPILALLLFFIYKLSLELFARDKKMACLALIFCGFSLSVLNMAVYIRMYLLWDCLFIILIYFTLKILLQGQFQCKEFALVGLMAFLCFMTHMYSLPYVFFLTASTCLFLLFQKQWQKSFLFGAVILSALLLAYVCFPYLFQIMLHSSRGEEFQGAVLNLDFNVLMFLYKFERFFKLLFSEIFNFPLLKTEYLLIFFIVAIVWEKMLHIRKTKMYPYAWWAFSFVLPTVVFVAFFSPYMGIYDDRYFAPILVVVALLILYWFNYFLKTLFLNKRKRTVILSLLIVFNLCFLNFSSRSEYLLQDSKLENFQEMVKNKPVLAWDYCNFNLLYLLSETQRFYLFEDSDNFPFETLEQAKGSLLFVSAASLGWQKYDKINIVPIPLKWKNRLDLMGTYQIGICFYDVYRIKN